MVERWSSMTSVSNGDFILFTPLLSQLQVSSGMGVTRIGKGQETHAVSTK